MKFDFILKEINEKYKTKLILDEVSFFEIENILEICFLSVEFIDIAPIKIFIEDKLKDLDINIELVLFTLDDLISHFNHLLPKYNVVFKDEILFIDIDNLTEISIIEQKEIYQRFKNKIDKLELSIEFQENEDGINDDYLKELELEKENNIKEEIKKANKKVNEVSQQKKIPKNGDLFTYGYRKKAPKDITEFIDLHEDPNPFSVKGTVYEIQIKPIKTSNIVTFDLDDGYRAIRAKLFVKDDVFEDFISQFKNGISIIASGIYKYDEFERMLCLNVSSMEETFLPKKIDMAEEKRIELNIHSKYSNLESIIDINELFERLKDYGHESVGITDLFNVQAYPEIYRAAKANDIKLNLGLQTNFTEDYPSLLTNLYNLEIKDKDFVVFDIETTGLSNFTDKIIEIGAVKVQNGKITDIYQSFVNPEESLSDFTTELTGITNSMVINAGKIDEVLPEFFEFFKDSILVAHNAEFDMGFIIAKANELNIPFTPVYMDTLYISRALNKDFKNHKLDTLAKEYQVNLLNHHRASDDAKATAEVFIKMLAQIRNLGFEIDKDINKIKTELPISNNKEYQNIFYAQNKIGLKNLYILVSKSNIDYFHRTPRIPNMVFENHREGLIIGTGNYKSKLFYLIALNYDDEVLEKEAEKFDFIILTPLDFSKHLINKSYIKDEEHLIKINEKLIEIANKQDKLAIAMGDVYYLDKKDYPYRNILKNYPRKRSVENSGAFYFKNTTEMLNEFNYLSEYKQKEVVIENPKKLDAMIENFSPIADGTFPPKIKDAEKTLVDDSYKVARDIYGENLPDIVEKRLERELNSIISNGYATLYIIAKMLVKKSNEDGYMVGSRGSVGSSFAATMAEITEVNPLPPHYICENCKYSDFVESTEYATGIDLPPRNCPNCNSILKKDGFDIPFETFLGFEGDKEPDIDLNFASVYQSKIHKYTESLFGKTKVFRAGTLGTIAEATAKGMARKYKDFYPNDDSIEIDNANLNRVKRKIVGVKRTTGQHAGGLIIVPENKDIEDFTPVQYPADDKSKNIITTHFDYHAIDKNLLKLDLLGHNSPTVIRLLADMSNIDPINIDFSDEATMSIFRTTEKLNIKHDYTNKDNGTLGIPEFGTTFVRGMLTDTKPTTFDELVRISGLSHGTDVWLGNAQELIRQGVADLRSAICTRDDIMNYLIQKGLDKKLSFNIMEKVRKGKGLTDEQIAEMKKNNVPQWYIDSCLKIKYMFPKAHAAAYVMMSFRIAYFKVHYPAYFYAVSFTNEIADFKYTHISKGLEYLTMYINSLKADPDFSVDNVFYVYEIAEEMFARDINFVDIDLYKSHATNFMVIDENTILPPLMAIENVSEAMALNIVEARKDGEFISKEDFIKRTKVNKTALASLEEIGLFDGLQETNQIDFFSL